MTELWAGEFGRYQWTQYLLHLLPAFTGGIHMLSQVEVGATPKHRCLALANDTILEYEGSCHYISTSNETLPCQSWEYEQTYYNSTIVTQWNLVCDRRWMASVSQSVYMVGALVAGALGQLSDRYGRWKVLVPTGALQMILAILCGFVNNYYFYTILRFLLAINVSGAYMVGFVLTMELSPDKYRTPIGFSFQLVFALGIAAVAGWGQLIRDWHILQIVFGAHSCLMLLHWWLVDESPRWLYVKGRYAEAHAIVCKQLMSNGKDVLIPEGGFSYEQLGAALGASKGVDDNDGQTQAHQAEDGQKGAPTSYGIVDLFKTRRLRNRTFNISLNWFANSLVYYGLSLNTGSLLGNPHLMLFVSGIIEVPAYIISWGVIDRYGRRIPISLCLVIGGLACIVTSYFPNSSWTWTTVTTCIVMLGKMFISSSFAIIYNYTAELFPTVVRSSAVGVGSTSARISGTLTPLIFLLDSLDPKLPSVLFGVVALAAGYFSLYLPETRDSPLLETLAQGESFGIGDTAFASTLNCCSKNKKPKTADDPPPQLQHETSLNDLTASTSTLQSTVVI